MQYPTTDACKVLSPPPHSDDEYLAEVRRIVDRAPRATPAQRDLITAILRPPRGGDV